MGVDTDGPALLVALLVGQVHDLGLRDGQLVPVLRVKVVQNRDLSEALNVYDLGGLGNGLRNGLGLLLVKGRPIVGLYGLGFISGLGGLGVVPRGPVVLDGGRGLRLRLIKTISTNLRVGKNFLASFAQKRPRRPLRPFFKAKLCII